MLRDAIIWMLVGVLTTLTVAKETVNRYDYSGDNHAYEEYVEHYYDDYLPKEIRVPKGEGFAIMCGDIGKKDNEYSGDTSDVNYQGEMQSGSGIPDVDIQNGVQCTITVEGEVKFNETINWENSCERGMSINSADETWNGTTVEVTVEDKTVKIEIIVEERDFKCYEDHFDDEETYEETIYIGTDSYPVKCEVFDWLMTKEQLQNISITWFHGCNKITEDTPGYTITKSEGNFMCNSSQIGVVLSELTIRQASLQSSPGFYHCVIESGSSSLQTTKIETNKVCLRPEHYRDNEPVIHTSQVAYVVPPGSDLTIEAGGNSGDGGNSLSRTVKWFKYSESTDEFDRICYGNDERCDETFQNSNFCEKLSEQDAEQAIKNIDSFTATFTLKNLTEKDNGLYQVKLFTTKPGAPANFTIRVYQPLGHNPSLAIALGVVFGVIFLFAVVAIILAFKHRTDIRYLYKKIFNGKPIRDTRPMAYLVYAADVFENKNNQYEAVRKFLGDRRYHDPENPGLMDNPAGHAVVDHTTDVMRLCMTVIFFVTEDILAEENHGMEVLEAYRALNENVQSQLPVIFITTRGAQDRLRDEENNNMALADFMKRQKNTVIYWNEKHPNRFRRALYVALPNVVYPSADDQITRV